MKKIASIVLFLAVLLGVQAQMAPAKMIPPRMKKSVKINVSAEKVWSMMNDFKNFAKTSNGLVESIEVYGTGRDAQRTLHFSSGEVREDVVSIYAPDTYLLAFYLKDHPIFQSLVYRMKVEKIKKDKCRFTVSAYFSEASKLETKNAKEMVKKELENYTLGMRKFFEVK